MQVLRVQARVLSPRVRVQVPVAQVRVRVQVLKTSTRVLVLVTKTQVDRIPVALQGLIFVFCDTKRAVRILK